MRLVDNQRCIEELNKLMQAMLVHQIHFVLLPAGPSCATWVRRSGCIHRRSNLAPNSEPSSGERVRQGKEGGDGGGGGVAAAVLLTFLKHPIKHPVRCCEGT